MRMLKTSRAVVSEHQEGPLPCAALVVLAAAATSIWPPVSQQWPFFMQRSLLHLQGTPVNGKDERILFSRAQGLYREADEQEKQGLVKEVKSKVIMYHISTQAAGWSWGCPGKGKLD